MSSFEPSSYQKDILNFIKNKNGNLLVDAKAGSGKTSTLCLIADEIIKKDKKCLFLAFNKSIVQELQNRIISDNVQIKTLHALGLSFLRSYLYKKHKENYEIVIDQHDDRIKQQVENLFNKYCSQSFVIATADSSPDDRKETLSTVLREISQLVNYSRLYNANYHNHQEIYDLAYKLCWELADWEDLGLKDFPLIIEDVIDKIKEDFEKPLQEGDKFIYNIGYTDMIYFPCLYRMTPPFATRAFLDYVLCDECQDLSCLQQLFLRRLDNGNTRYIMVGDEKQAIYGFAGADTRSITNLKKNFVLDELPLNICYRCPENVIKIAQDLVSSIDWNHDREDKGEVEFVEEFELKDKIKPGDAILARRNNDLVILYKKLVIDDKISVKFRNSEMVTTIVTEIKRVIKDYIKRYNKNINVERDLYKACEEQGINWKKDDDSWLKHEKDFLQKTYNSLVKAKKALKKSITKSNYSVDYLGLCMNEYKEEGDYNYTYAGMPDNVLAEYYDIIDNLLTQFKEASMGILVTDFIQYVEGFLKGNLNKEAPILSSIHMMKGGEADNVYLIDYPRFPYIYSNQNEDARQQERNLQYVALTRVKKNLYLCKVSRCRGRETEDDLEKLNTTCEMQVKQLLNRVKLI